VRPPADNVAAPRPKGGLRQAVSAPALSCGEPVAPRGDPCRILSPREVGERIPGGASDRTLAHWRVTGEGPPYCRAGGRKIGYPEPQFIAWLASRTFTSRAAELVAEAGK
jgi:hypothetical protein